MFVEDCTDAFFLGKSAGLGVKVLIKKRLRHPEKAKVSVKVSLPKPPWLRVKAPAGKYLAGPKVKYLPNDWSLFAKKQHAQILVNVSQSRTQLS